MIENKAENLLDNFYEEFVGLPNGHAIVRNNHKEDAFTLVILEVLYSKVLDLRILPKEIEKISKIIVAPPDSGIDLFIEIEDGNNYHYDIIQAKYQVLSEHEIRQCFLQMKDTIKTYCKKPKNVQENLRQVIKSTCFNDGSSNHGNNCTYYVIHKGDKKFIKGQNDKFEKIVTLTDIIVILESLNDTLNEPKVPYDEFKSDSFNNFFIYPNNPDNSSDCKTLQENQTLLCNLRGYELALLCNKYINTSMGRNVLFGQNLRESLKKSKAYDDMVNTIEKAPQKFWNYNNGITILTENLDIVQDNDNTDKIQLQNFSIINGAQTTSTLGKYLEEAERDNEFDKIENLKRIYVLARIMRINDSEFRDKISIYNNSQNPISSRDMVSTRLEQKMLHTSFADGEKPNIYIEIRRGSTAPSATQYEKHQRTKNEDLAQLAFAAFLSQPFSAKDKKKSLFNKDSSSSYPINKEYSMIFNYSNEGEDENLGILFQKSRLEIDEVLFIAYLYEQAKKLRKSQLNEMMESNIESLEHVRNEAQKKLLSDRISIIERNISICTTCKFYCITYYYELKKQFPVAEKNMIFDYNKFYRYRDFDQNQEYKNGIIEYFSDKFLKPTIDIIGKIVKTDSVNNWLRRSKSQDEFLSELNEKLCSEMDLRDDYNCFVEKFMIDY